MDVSPNNEQTKSKTTAWIQVSVQDGRSNLEALLSQVETLVGDTPAAEATMQENQTYCNGEYGRTLDVSSGGSSGHGPATVTAGQTDPNRKSVLVLGAGLVAAPAVEMLSRDPTRTVVLISGIEGEAAALAARLGRPNVQARTMDCGSDAAGLEAAVSAVDTALSLLPAPMHGSVVDFGIRHGTPIVTASYVSEELWKMADAAKAAGVPVLGEMGLDPVSPPAPLSVCVCVCARVWAPLSQIRAVGLLTSVD
jgi:alpha-aminoadipic semialdehyde synthase